MSLPTQQLVVSVACASWAALRAPITSSCSCPCSTVRRSNRSRNRRTPGSHNPHSTVTGSEASFVQKSLVMGHDVMSVEHRTAAAAVEGG